MPEEESEQAAGRRSGAFGEKADAVMIQRQAFEPLDGKPAGITGRSEYRNHRDGITRRNRIPLCLFSLVL